MELDRSLEGEGNKGNNLKQIYLDSAAQHYRKSIDAADASGGGAFEHMAIEEHEKSHSPSPNRGGQTF